MFHQYWWILLTTLKCEHSLFETLSFHAFTQSLGVTFTPSHHSSQDLDLLWVQALLRYWRNLLSMSPRPVVPNPTGFWKLNLSQIPDFRWSKVHLGVPHPTKPGSRHQQKLWNICDWGYSSYTPSAPKTPGSCWVVCSTHLIAFALW